MGPRLAWALATPGLGASPTRAQVDVSLEDEDVEANYGSPLLSLQFFSRGVWQSPSSSSNSLSPDPHPPPSSCFLTPVVLLLLLGVYLRPA